MKDDSSPSFSLGSIFGKTSDSTPSFRGSVNLEPHPSERDHINPLNLLTPPSATRRAVTVATEEGEALPVHSDVVSGVLPNGLSYVILPNRSPPGRFEAHLQVFSGS
eukprot:4387493-Ditylum_brightwellii.AAC.1